MYVIGIEWFVRWKAWMKFENWDWNCMVWILLNGFFFNIVKWIMNLGLK